MGCVSNAKLVYVVVADEEAGGMMLMEAHNLEKEKILSFGSAITMYTWS